MNGVAAAPFMVIVMLISGDRRIMGKERNRALAMIVGWTATIAMTVAGIAGLADVFLPS